MKKFIKVLVGITAAIFICFLIKKQSVEESRSLKDITQSEVVSKPAQLNTTVGAIDQTRQHIRSSLKNEPRNENEAVEKNNSTAKHQTIVDELPSDEITNLDLPIEVLAEDQISPNTIFNEQKYTPDDIKDKFESSLKKLETVASVAKVEEIECTQKECRMILSEKLPDNAQADLYAYYLDHPQFGKYIHSDRSKDDPNKIVYTFSDEVTYVEAK